MQLDNNEIEAILRPLDGDQPCGSSARYEPEYETIETEVAKQESLTPEPVDWGEVLQLAGGLLKNTSKDLLLATYLTYGAFLRDGYSGLAGGLTVYDGFIKNYWDNLFPEKKRMRGRIAAATWLAEKLEKQLTAERPVSNDKDAVQTTLGLLESINNGLSEKLGADAPDFASVIRLVREYSEGFAKAEKVEASKPVAAPTAAGGTASATIEVQADGDIPKATKHCQDVLKQLAAYLRNKSLDDPRSYRMNRISAWLAVEQLPPNDEGVTQIPALQVSVTEKYETYLQNGEYALLIQEIEQALSRTPFWLGAHRLVVAALESLGPKYEKAKQAVIVELASLLQRFPALKELKFLDGTGFGDDKTLMWIDNDVTVSSGKSVEQGKGSGENPAGVSAWEVILGDARKFAAKGKFNEGLALFQTHARGGVTRREEFLWRLAQARFCVDSGYVDMAIPQLESLDAASQEMRLQDWEPELSADVMQLLLKCYEKRLATAKKTNGILSKRTDDVYSRLCLVDTAAALEVYEKPWLKRLINSEYE